MKLIYIEQKINGAFSEYNIDKDNFISFGELKKALESISIKSSKESLETFTGAGDIDQSGELDIHEFKKAIEEFGGVSE